MCMRECWIEHDRCAINCPCNEECPNGCPVADLNHECDTWFCKGQISGKGCAAENDPDRLQCNGNNEAACLNLGCCWVPYVHQDDITPYCHYQKDIIIEIPRY